MVSTQTVCAACRAIDFQYLLQHPQRDALSGNIEPPNHPKFFLKYSPGCAVCDILVPSGFPRYTWELLSEVYPHSVRWTSKYVLGSADDAVSLISLSTRQRFQYPDLHMNGPVMCVPAGKVGEGHFVPRVVGKTPNYTLAKFWLQCCLQSHSGNCGSYPFRIPGLRLIDVETLVIVPAEWPCHYLALSYVWGSPNNSVEPDTPRDPFSLPSQLAQTVQDAITATKNLGHRFLWVDEYCIDQNDPEHKAEQIGSMDRVYRAADLTIVAAAGEDKMHGLPGVSNTNRKQGKVVHLEHATLYSTVPDPNVAEIERSKWLQRAWTFQEGVLAGRLLIFTEHQMVFYCQSASWAEGIPPREPEFYCNWSALDQEKVALDYEQRPEKIFQPIFVTPTPWNNHPLIRFMTMVLLYTKRQLTYVSDTLNAFSGAMSVMRQAEHIVYNIKGLPYCLWFQAEAEDGKIKVIPRMAEQALLAALPWQRSGKDRDIRLHLFPSWTWADWTGTAVTFEHLQHAISIHEPTTRSVRFEGRNGEVFTPLPLLAEPASDFQERLNTVTALHFTVPILTSTLFTRKEPKAAGGMDASAPNYNFASGRNWTYPWDLFKDMDVAIEKMDSGVWSLLLLGKHGVPENYRWFVLVVQWRDEDTAERLGLVTITSSEEEDRALGSVEERLECRRVRLV